MATPVFHWADYLVFTFALGLSLGIGIFYAAMEKRKKNGNKTEEFLLAGRKMSAIPVSISLFVSWTSAISFLGDPVEVYYHGIVYVYVGLGYALACPVVAHLFAPFFFNLKITSAYEFLEKRYCRVLRYLSCIVLLLCGVLYLAVVVYGPSVALSQVTGIPEWLSIIIIGAVGTFYTTLGGMKAVLWVDTFQSIIMFVGVVALVVIGMLSSGGFYQVLLTASEHDRMNFLKSDLSPLTRSSMWTYLFGGFCRVFNPYISTQVYIQRYSSLRSSRDAKLAVYLNIPMFLTLVSLFGMTGLVMFAYYEGCDPLQNGRISSPNQLVPLFMLDVMGFLPGMSGLFLACLFSASLSSLSSTMNSIAANTLVDIISPLYTYFKATSIGDNIALGIAKTASVVSGVAVVMLAFGVLYGEGELFAMTVKITGVLSSPTAGLFFLGRLCPFVDYVSASIGFLSGLAINVWWVLGAMVYPPRSQALPLSQPDCYIALQNYTVINNNSLSTQHYLSDSGNSTSGLLDATETNIGFHVADMYAISPLLFGTLGLMTSVIVAVIVALAKGGVRRLCSSASYKGEYHMAEIIASDTGPQHQVHDRCRKSQFGQSLS